MTGWNAFYQSPGLQLLAGGAAMTALVLPVRWRYQTLLRRGIVDLAALAAYWWSSFWLSAFLGFVVAFLPAFVKLCLPVVTGTILLTSALVGRTYRPV